ncbi:MAG: tRNA lysidine(34) synthetase TilS [Gammaproteobacteria bacterium]|nr:tRNA lysidine(34) synthetase TilS [Gammaproteobacteria bacterium]
MKTAVLETARNKVLDLFTAHKKIFVAYSGGLDSHVLLHLLSNLCQGQKKSKIKLAAIHVDHNLSPKSKKWAKHCQRVCKKLDIEYIGRDIPAEVVANGDSLEEVLRDLRYEIFAKILPKNGCVLTAHHAQDQAETLLLQLFRGAGLKGLAAMPGKTKFASGCLARPLLESSHNEILSYAKKYKLKWIEDESNLDPKFDRNFIRHQLLPVIKEKWQGVVGALNRTSRHCAEANELLDILAEKDLLDVFSDDDKYIINIDCLKKFTFIRQKTILRYWLHRLHLSMPSEVKLNEVMRTVVNSRYDAMPVVRWHGVEVRRFRNNLYASSPLIPHDPKIVLSFSGKSLKLPSNLGVLKLKVIEGTDFDLKKIRISFRQGGEKLKIQNRAGTHDLKNLMQEWGIPPWLRDRIPLVYYGAKMIAVVGYYNVNWAHFQIAPLASKRGVLIK